MLSHFEVISFQLTAVILGILSVAKNYREATDSKRYVLRVEAVVAEKLYAGSRANQQKILRYWTKYASLCASFLVGLHS